MCYNTTHQLFSVSSKCFTMCVCCVYFVLLLQVSEICSYKSESGLPFIWTDERSGIQEFGEETM